MQFERQTGDESRTLEYLTELLRSILLVEGIRRSSEFECMMVSPVARKSRRFVVVYTSVTVPALFIGRLTRARIQMGTFLFLFNYLKCI